MIRDLIIKNRSYRRFVQNHKIPTEVIKEWIELARFSASGRNSQPLKYVISNTEETNAKIFTTLGWAGYLTSWHGPEEGERPAAYIIIGHDKSISPNYFCDDGIAAQSILLGAVESGFGGCMIASFNKAKVAKIIESPENIEVLMLIALGKPAEKVVIEEIKDNDIKYWRDGNNIHHVPKRPLDELILKTL